ncbi:hypothetical protein ACLBXJ_02865 [Methylobacterium mesophilicum]
MAPLIQLDDAVDVHANDLEQLIQQNDLEESFSNRYFLTKEPHMG